jgi:hypothetical protein
MNEADSPCSASGERFSPEEKAVIEKLFRVLAGDEEASEGIVPFSLEGTHFLGQISYAPN